MRVLALGMLMIFQSCMGFSSWRWHVVDSHGSIWLGDFLDLLWRWRVALVFVVSGAALMLALGKHTPRGVLRERLQRLALPMIFGVLVIVPPQVYLERLQRGQFRGSYLDYLPHFADGIYPAGNVSWHHLWFVPYVLAGRRSACRRSAGPARPAGGGASTRWWRRSQSGISPGC